MVGQKFGKLLVLEFDSIKIRPGANKKARYWKCLCECGQYYIGHTNSLNSGRVKTCGKCYKPSKNFKGFGNLSKCYFNQIKRHAISRNRYFDNNLTCQFLWELFIKQNEKCALTGLPLVLSKSRNSQMNTASLDRIDSSKGYLLDNVQWVHKTINCMKSNLKLEDFLFFCKSVTTNNNL